MRSLYLSQGEVARRPDGSIVFGDCRCGCLPVATASWRCPIEIEFPDGDEYGNPSAPMGYDAGSIGASNVYDVNGAPTTQTAAATVANPSAVTVPTLGFLARDDCFLPVVEMSGELSARISLRRPQSSIDARGVNRGGYAQSMALSFVCWPDESMSTPTRCLFRMKQHVGTNRCAGYHYASGIAAASGSTPPTPTLGSYAFAAPNSNIDEDVTVEFVYYPADGFFSVSAVFSMYIDPQFDQGLIGL